MLGTAVVLLGACGLFNVTVDDPLGLEGQPISVRVVGTTPSITAQAVATGTSDPVNFNNIDTGGITPGTFSIEQELDGSATVEVPSGPLPEVITLSDVTLSVNLSDDGGNNAAKHRQL